MAKRLSVILWAILMMTAACAPQPSATTSSTSANEMDVSQDTSASENAAAMGENLEPTVNASSVEPAPAAAVDLPAWFNISLRDVNTGASFTFADFVGRAVYVHPMATWCTNCRASQRALRDSVVGEFTGDEVEFVSLSVETSLSDGDLQAYTDAQGFNWQFAVATPELMTALVQQFGVSVGNPPSQPHFIVRPDGTVTTLLLGNPPASQTIADLRAALSVMGS